VSLAFLAVALFILILTSGYNPPPKSLKVTESDSISRGHDSALLF